MAKKPSEVLRKSKQTDKDDKKGKAPRKNGLLDFIAKHKKVNVK